MINRSSRPIATLFGIPLHLHWSAMLTALFIAVSASTVVGISDAGLGATLVVGSLAAVLFGVSLLAHEYAHALMARHHGIGVRRVSMWALGGLAELETEPRKWSHEFSVSVVGPLASLAIGGVSLGAALGFDAAGLDVPSRLFGWLAILNIGLGVFNLLPGFPLDGGRVLHSLIWWRTRDRIKATLFTASSGRFIGALLIAAGVWMFTTGGSGLLTGLIGWFILSSATQARTQARHARRLTGRRAGDVARPVPMAVHGDLTVGDFLTYWVPANPTANEVVLLIDRDNRASGLLPMSAVWAMPPAHRDQLPLSALAIPAASLGVVGPNTDLGDAFATSPSGYILVSEPDRLIGVIMPTDLARPWQGEPTPTAAGAPS